MINLKGCLRGNQRACRVQWECHYFLVKLSWRKRSPCRNGSAGPKAAENSCRIMVPPYYQSPFRLLIFVVVVDLERAVRTCQPKLSIY